MTPGSEGTGQRFPHEGEAKRLAQLEAAIYAYTGFKDAEHLLSYIEECRVKVRLAEQARDVAVSEANVAKQERDRALVEAGRAMTEARVEHSPATMMTYYSIQMKADHTLFSVGNRRDVLHGVFLELADRMRRDWKVGR